jgi:glycine/D-amino acid oxidase-like deaminating enzyme
LLGHSPVTVAYDLAIVGAGIVGAACAAECARSGLKVVVLERDIVGGGTTAAGMGHIVVMDDSAAQFALTSYSRQLWHDISSALPPQVEYDQCGTLWVAADQEEMVEVRRKESVYQEHGVRIEVLDSEGLRQLEPNLRPDLAGALRVPEDAVLYPPAAARFLLEQAEGCGAEVRHRADVRNLKQDGSVELNDGTVVHAYRCLLATGPWAAELVPGLPIRKRKGHLVITDRYPGFARHQIVELGYLKSAQSQTKDSVAFNIQPRKNGQMLIGSSRQFDAEDTSVEQPILERMLNRALSYMPPVGRLSAIRCWSGHRPATPDKLPLIGPSAPSDRIWLATGHEGLGITTSLGTAKLVADLMIGRKSSIRPEPYSPARFTSAKSADRSSPSCNQSRRQESQQE